jgi:hypothetical protein
MPALSSPPIRPGKKLEKIKQKKLWEDDGGGLVSDSIPSQDYLA